MIVEAFAVFLAILIFYLFQSHQKVKWPSGPKGLPFVGNALQFDEAGVHHTLYKWAKQYEDIFRIKVLGSNIIVISGANQALDAMVKYSKEFSGRPNLFRFRRMFDGETISSYYGPRTMKLKSLIATSMKMYGHGHKHLEGLIQEVLEEITSTFASKNGEPFDPSYDIIKAVNNSISTEVYGCCLPEEVISRFQEFDELMTAMLSPGGTGFELEILPWLRFLPSKSMQELNRIKHLGHHFTDPIIEERRNVFDPDNPSCLLDSLWCKQATAMDDDGLPLLPDSTIRAATLELVSAGTSTTYATMLGFLALVAKNQHIQKDIQAQIDQVIGERRPMLTDKGSLPLVEATLLETLRYISSFQIIPPHMTVADVDFYGFTIPKHTEVWINVWSLNHDERYWENPWTFQPQRFLDDEGKLLSPNHPTRKRFLQFGAGHRVCLGEVLAKNRLFLLMSTLLQQFTFLPPEGGPEPCCDPRKFRSSMIIIPDRYQIRAVQRLHSA